APTEAKLVRMKNGKPATDGVFAESKEYLAGFWIVDVGSRERAYALAAEVTTAPLPPDIVLEVEVREVMSVASHEACGT
ncbi:MAG TPA: YciI family protein, partial [Xanthomonadales bacterium]|nr:YciI family protein [Xanthomonadales bacterium]